MENYIGKSLVEGEIEYDIDKVEWAIRFILEYKNIDGAHHKDWLIDQVLRIL